MPVLSFAEAWRDAQAEPLTVTVRPFDSQDPEEHTLPGSMPAGVRLALWEIRDHKDPDLPLSVEDYRTLAEFLFGPLTVAEWVEQRIEEGHLIQVVAGTLAEYTAREARDDTDDAEDVAARAIRRFGGPSDMLEHWDAICGDFLREYQVDLRAEGLRTLPWDRFLSLLSGLSAESRWIRLVRAEHEGRPTLITDPAQAEAIWRAAG